MVSSAGTRAPTKASMITRSAYPSRSAAMPRRPSVPRTLIPLRVGQRQVATDEGGELGVRLEHDLRGARTRRRHIPRQGHRSAANVDHAQPLPGSATLSSTSTSRCT